MNGRYLKVLLEHLVKHFIIMSPFKLSTGLDIRHMEMMEESITRASEVLHITQPTLSRQLAQMEEEILQLVDKTEKELVEQEEQVEGKISNGCGEIASVQLLPKLFREFH